MLLVSLAACGPLRCMHALLAQWCEGKAYVADKVSLAAMSHGNFPLISPLYPANCYLSFLLSPRFLSSVSLQSVPC